VKEDPWASWRIKVRVQGNDSLRVRTPLFRGNISTSLDLEGTLKDPIALGHVKIDSGSVTFPFGSLDVKQGFISLTSEDPFHPQLLMNAAGRRFGYEIKLEAAGNADRPIIQLSSIPPLPSDQIILMLTAGQTPRGLGISTSTGQQAQGFALFVGKNLLSDFGLGLGGEDRLTYRSGEQISQSGRATYELDYKLTERWSLIGQYDRFDQYNLNLKWKVYSK
jgi:translocation and assembly module TamB